MNTRAAIYLDHAATTPQRPEVAAAIANARAEGYANPSSQHAAGRRARQLLDDARQRILLAVGGRCGGPGRDRLVFTSGATEANALAVTGMARAARRRHGTTFLAACSDRDHASVRHAMESLEPRGWAVTVLPLDRSGRLDEGPLAGWTAAAAGAAAAILATTVVCGQTGVCEQRPLGGDLAAATAGGLVHADATQAWAVLDLPFGDTRAATMTLAPHKFGGPRGIGGLVIRGDVAIEPEQPGTQEYGLRAGTEAVDLAVGFACAVELAAAERAAVADRLRRLRDRFEGRLVAAARAAGIPAAVIAADGERAAHVSTVAFPGVDRQALVMAADLAGVWCATGAACSSGASEPAPALLAMGLPPGLVRSAVRFSCGRTTTEDDVDAAVARLGTVLARLGRGPDMPDR